MTWEIREAREEDMDAVHELVRELAEFEHAANEVATDATEYREDGFGPVPAFHVLVAENSEGVIDGLAFYGFWYSTWKGRMLYLDDLVVRGSQRKRGLGQRLLQELARRAIKARVREMRWQVLDWNQGARRLYERVGAKQDESWINCRLALPAMERLAAEPELG